MKKHVISFLAFLAVAGLCISCDKSNQDPTPTPTPKTADMQLLVAVGSDQNQFVNQSYEIKVNGTITTVDLSKMTEVTDLKKYKSFTDAIEVLVAKNFKLYIFDLGTISSGQSVIGSTKTFTMKSGRPSQATFNLIDAYTFSEKSLGPVGPSNTGLHAGVYNTDEAISAICKILSGNMGISYSIQ